MTGAATGADQANLWWAELQALIGSPPGGGVLTRRAKTTAYTALLWDEVSCDTTGGTFAVTLPSAAAGSGMVVVKWTVGTTAPTVVLSGSDHFNTATGPTSGGPTLLNQAQTFESDGVGIWTVTSDDVPLSGLDARYVQGSVVTAKGDILGATTAGALTNVAVGANTTVLTADSTQPAGVKWAAAAGGASGGLAVYGDGSDGTVTFDGTTTLLGIVPSANTYTLTRDLYLTAGTINNGVTINTTGFRVFCVGTLTNNGTISNNGAPYVSGVSGGSGGGGRPAIGGGGGGGGNASNGNGNAGTNETNSLGAAGGAGGAGGTGSSGAGGTATAPSAGSGSLRATPMAVLGLVFNGSGLAAFVQGGGGGGGGGGDGTNFGNGGGGGGALCIVAAKAIAGTGNIQARGGSGRQSGGGGNSGGGGGGGGGAVLIVSGSVSSGAVSGQTIDANGGGGGIGSGTGVNGTAGSAGTVILISN